MSKCIAILCSDLHLSQNPPVVRSIEPDWFEAMKRVLDKLRNLAEAQSVPVLCAGDLFDRWRSSPELINFAFENLPYLYAIPGQHDLPYHDIGNIKKSCFWTLMKGFKIRMLDEKGLDFGGFVVYGFPWGAELKPPKKTDSITVGLVHRYLWIEGYEHPCASEETHLLGLDAKGFDVIVSGDNHQGFLTEKNGTTVFNCGTMMRRKSDEAEYVPQVGLLMSDGSVIAHPLEVEEKVERTITYEAEEDMELDFFLKNLSDLKDIQLDFPELVNRYIEDRSLNPGVISILLEALENGKHR